MTLPFKIGVGSLTIGTIASATYLGTNYLTSNEHKATNKRNRVALNKLIEEKYEYILLDTSNNNKDQAKWAENWKSYKEDGKDIFNLSGWVEGQEDLDLTTELKKECEKLSKNEVFDNEKELYGNVTKYCARGVTFEEQAKKENLEILETNTEKHKTIWDEKFSDKAKIDLELKKIGISTPPSDANKIKTGCSTARSKNKQITDYEAIYKAYKSVCTK